jgi:tellurite resistance protein
MLTIVVPAMSAAMDTETLAGYLELAGRLTRDIDHIVERRRAALQVLEREGSDTSKARRFLGVAEELQRMIWSDKEQLEKEMQVLLKRQDG